jgi:hypothetical protein
MVATFEPKNLLEIALQNAATDPAARPLFLRELLASKVLIVPAGERPPVVDGVVPEGTTIGMATIPFNGRTCVPFYTSEARLPAATGYLLLDAKALFQITRGAYLVMNPGAAYGKEFFPDEIARLLDGTAFEPQERYVMPRATQVTIGQPKDFPHELVDALARLYAGIPEVKRAWVALYHNPARDQEPGLIIAVDVPDEQAMPRISGESGVVVDSLPKKQAFVDLVRYDGSGLTGYFADQTPFYRRSFFGQLWRKLRG